MMSAVRFPLIDLVNMGQLDAVKAYLAHAPHAVHETDEMGYCAVFAAVSRNDAEMLEVLIQAGASVDIEDAFGRTPLRCAREYPNLQERIEQLLADNWHRKSDLVSQAIVNADLEALTQLSLQVDLARFRDKNGHTCLEIATDVLSSIPAKDCTARAWNVVKFLTANCRSEPKIQVPRGCHFPMCEAVRRDNLAMIRWLAKCCDVNAKVCCGSLAENIRSPSALRELLQHGLVISAPQVDLLLTKLEVPNIPFVLHEFGLLQYPLHTAIALNCPALIRHLLSSKEGAKLNINDRDRWSRTPLDVLVQNHRVTPNLEFVKTMLRLGAKLSHRVESSFLRAVLERWHTKAWIHALTSAAFPRTISVFIANFALDEDSLIEEEPGAQQ